LNSESEILALNINPAPKGFELFESDLNEEIKILKLFDSCQILQSIIYPKGWEYLLKKYGLIKLYEIDLESGWFDTDNKKEWLESILYNSLIAGFNAQTGDFGEYNEQTGTFKTIGKKAEIIDWEKFKSRDYLLEYKD